MKTLKDYSLNKPDTIYGSLKDSIVSLELIPGRAVSENDLTEHYGTSRTTIRAVLQKLKHEGFIEIIPQKGTFVTYIDLDVVGQITNVWFLAEREACFKICASRENTALEKLLGLIERLRLDEEDVETFVALDMEFHKSLYDAAGMTDTWEFLSSYGDSFRRMSNLYFRIPGKIALANDEHRQICDELRSGNSTAATDVLQSHSHLLDSTSVEYLKRNFGEFFV